MMRVFLSEFALTGVCVEAVELSNSYRTCIFHQGK